MEVKRILLFLVLLISSFREVQLENIRDKECLCDVKYTHVGFVSYARLVPTVTRTHYTYDCLDFRKFFKCEAVRLIRREKYIKVYKKKYFIAVKQVPCCCAGYEENELNKCQPLCTDSCQNGGRCTGPNMCSCTKGWTGHDCSIDVNECRLNETLCQQNCENTEGSYTCSCYPGFYKDPSNSNKCLSHTVRLIKFRIRVQESGVLLVNWKLGATFVLTELLQSLQLSYSYPIDREVVAHSINISLTDTQVSTQVIYPGTPVQLSFNLIYKSDMRLENQPELTGTTQRHFRLPDPNMEFCLDYYNLQQQYAQTREQSNVTYTPNPCPEGTVCVDQSTPPYFSCEQ